MFENASSFNQSINNWNTGKVIYFDNMFKNAIAFNQGTSNLIFSPSLVSTISMFEGASAYNQNMIKSTILPSPLSSYLYSASSYSSIYFNGTISSNLSIASDFRLQPRRNNFTIEWWQYQLFNLNSYITVFSLGTIVSTALTFQIDKTSLTYLINIIINDVIYTFASITSSNYTTYYVNQWVHLAIVRNSSTSMSLYRNGTLVSTIVIPNIDIYNEYLNTSYGILRIGNYNSFPVLSSKSFSGYITSFKWTNGTALYTSNFTISSIPATASE